MSKNIKISIYIIALLGIVAGIWFWSENVNTSQKIAQTVEEANEVKGAEIENSSDVILFYGVTCSACKETERYMKENKIEEKIAIEKKEVYYNKENANLLGEKAQECGLDTKSVGVPFLFSKGNCYIGTEEIKDFFEGSQIN